MLSRNLSRNTAWIGFVLTAFITLSLSGCGGSGGGGSAGAVPSPGPSSGPAGTLTSIAITPASAVIATGTYTKLIATGTYSGGGTADISASVTWTSASPGTVKVDTGGLVTAVAAGSTTITATSGSISSSPDPISVTAAATPLDLWTTQAPINTARDNDANAVLNGQVFVFGGAPTGTSVLASMEVYDPPSNTWPGFNALTLSPWPSMPAPRYGPAAVAINGVIYIMGGANQVNGQGPIYPILAFDPKTNAFLSTVPGTSTPLADLPTGRNDFHAVAVDGLIYAIGGGTFVPGGITVTNWMQKTASAVSGTPIVLPSTANGTPYYFIVTAVNASTGAESPASVEVSATPQASFAMGPTPSAVGTVAGNGQATLNWVGVAGASSYNVYYSTKSNDATARQTKVSAGAATSATIKGLANGTAYYFVVTAVTGGVETPPSIEAGVTPQPAPPATAPSNLTITAGNAQATLTWAPVPNAASYNVYYGTGVSVYYGNVEVYDPVANTWTAKASMPTPRQGMALSVVDGRIYAIGGWGGWPELSTVEVYDPAANAWATTVPVTLATMAAGTAAKPLVQMPTARDDFGSGVVNGIIYTLGGDTNAFDAVLGIPCCTTVVEAYDPVANTWTTKAPMLTMRDDFDASVVDGVIYAIAGSRDGQFVNPGLPNDGGFSLTANEAYNTSSIPVPKGLAAASGANQASLSWQPVAGATSYNIYWSNKAGVSTRADSTMIPAVTGTAYTHTGLTAGVWYHYVVTAMTPSGESLPSAEVAVKP